MSMATVVKKLENPALGLDLLRIYVGVALFVRGATFIAYPEALIDYMNRSDLWAMPLVLSHYVVAVHIAGGILLALGLLTRVAAAAQVPVLLGAVFLVHWREGLLNAGQSLELSALVLAVLVVLTAFGAGELSLDHVLAKAQPESLTEADVEAARRAEQLAHPAAARL